jgi:hypothetical protein
MQKVRLCRYDPLDCDTVYTVYLQEDTNVSEEHTASNLSPPKRWYPPASPYGVTTQKTTIDIFPHPENRKSQVKNGLQTAVVFNVRYTSKPMGVIRDTS